MIDEKELRIGNFVLAGELGKPYQIMMGDEIDNSEYYDPIPLTPEILEQCGFTLSDDNRRTYELEKGNCKIIVFIDGSITVTDESYLEVHGICIGGNEKTQNYLHQLQNLFFALTGEELKIKELA